MGDYLMSLIKANNITNVTGGIPTVKSQQLIPTAWVNFNGQNTVAIRDSENVSSITDSGTGYYTVNFATVMANDNYSGVANFHRTVTWTGSGIEVRGSTNRTTSYVRVRTMENSVADDEFQIDVIILGGQA